MIPLIIILLNLNAVVVPPEPVTLQCKSIGQGEARESTLEAANGETPADSRGGVQHSWFVHSELSDFISLSGGNAPLLGGGERGDDLDVAKIPPAQSPKISPAEMWVRLQEEGAPWTEPPILKGNSAIDRLRHDPE